MKKLHAIALLLSFMGYLGAQNVNISTQVIEVTHSYDCGNDAQGVCCGCWPVSICDDPEPRWIFWGGHSNGNFQSPVLINGGTRACGVWNIPNTALSNHSNVNATQVNFDMESWEEDGCGSDNTYDSGCWPNPDDGRTNRMRLANISFRNASPCGTSSYGFYYGNHGYGGKFSIYWEWAQAPTFTLQPNANGNYSVCPGVPLELSAETNTANGYNMGRYFQWQSSANNVSFSNISGATGKTYVPQTATSGTTYYRVLATSNCTANFSTNTATSLSVTVVVRAASDATCNLPTCNAIYVDPINGNDAHAINRPNTPWQTVGKAMGTIASNNTTLTYIKVGRGTSTETATLVMKPHVIIEGGYLPGTGSTSWQKSSTSGDLTLLSFTNAAVRTENNDVRNLTAIYSNNTSNWTVRDLNIQTANATGNAANGQGTSNYGFHIVNNSSNYIISRVNIQLGSGSNGTAGSTPAGSGGGGAGGSGGGGSGGSSDGNRPNTASSGSSGNGGAAGGAGGSSLGSSSSGCTLCACGCNRQGSGQAGSNGNNAGGASTSYSAGDRPTLTLTNVAYFTPGGRQNGSNGFGGGGGGGGQGGRGGRLSCGSCTGNNGGRGGDGGNGGLGGPGGFGGGGVFGIWRHSSSTNVAIADVNISIGSAGNGGNGANGQTAGSSNGGRTNGGTSGSCAAGACGNTNGGNGGNGGSGSAGGRGRDGANGLTANTVINGSPSTTTATIPRPTVYINNGTERSNMPGLICINSEITLQKTTGNWALPSGMTFIDDRGTGSPSYGIGDNIVKTTVATAGAYNITANSLLLNGFVQVAPTTIHNRTKPVVVASRTSICEGGTVSFSVTGSYNSANIIEREWRIYTDAQGPGSPHQSSTAIGPVVTFNTVGTYRVRYRERHNCCGWSTPSFQTITVTQDPIAPSLALTPNDATICRGGQVKAVITPGSAGTGCTEAYEYRIDGGGWLPYTSNTLIGGSALSSISIRAVRSCTGEGCTPIAEEEHTWSVVNPPVWLTNTITPALNCLGGIVTFNATVHGGAGGSIHWVRSLTPGGTGIVVTSPDYPPSTGTYYYRPIYTSTYTGCTLGHGTEHTIPIIIGTVPDAANPISGPVSVTFAQQGVVYSTTPVANAVTYDWTVPSGAVIVSGQGTTSIVVDFTTATGGDVVVWPTNGLCVGDPDYHTVTVGSLPLIWTGNVDNSWNVAGNWSTNNVPTLADDVLIPVSRPHYPQTYTASPVAKKLMIENNASVTLEPGFDLTISGDIEVFAGGRLEVTAQAGATPAIRIGGNWSVQGNFIPATGTVYFDGSQAQQIIGDAFFYSLQIANTHASGVSISSGTTKIHGGLNLDEGSITTNNRLTIASDANGTGWVNDFTTGMNGSIDGNIIVQRYFAPASFATAFHYIGSPVNNLPVATELSELALYGPDGGQLMPTSDCNPNGLLYYSPYGTLFEWRENANFTVNCTQSGWFVRSAGTLANARGYAAIINRSAPFTLDVMGIANTGSISYANVAKTTVLGDGWHLVSNPYPSPIIWNAPAGFIGAAHFWNSSGSYSGTYQASLSGIGVEIPSMQSFFIQVSGTGPSNFALSNNDRTTGDNANFQRQANWYDHILNVELEGNGFADRTVIYFGTNPTDGWDDLFDAQKKESRPNQPTLYTRIANYPKYVGINGLPTNNSRVVSVPMGMLVGTAGTYTFTFNDIVTFDATTLIYLEDLKTGTLQNLRANNVYNFTSTLADDPERFVIHFYPPAVVSSTDADCEGSNGSINVDLGIFNIGNDLLVWDSYALVDSTGNTVFASTNVNGNISIANLAAGNYTLQLSIQGYQTSQAISVEAPIPADAAYAPDFGQAYTLSILGFSNQSSNALYYNWSFGDGNTSTLADPTHIYNQPGLYDVTLVASNDECSDTYTSKVEVLEVTVGLPTDVQTPSVRITSYGDIITIGFLNLADPVVKVDIFDLTGRRIIETLPLETSQAKHEIKMRTIPIGYYFVRVTGPNTKADEKIFLTSDR